MENLKLESGIYQYDKKTNEIKLYWNVPVIPKASELKIATEYLNNCPIKLIPQLRLSLDQMRLIKVLTSEYGVILGYEQPEMQEILRDEFCELYELEWFSTSPYKKEACTVQIATKFIDFIINHAIVVNDIYLYVQDKKNNRAIPCREYVNDFYSYVVACFLNKKCVVCGQRHEYEQGFIVDYDHAEKVAREGGRKYDDGLNLRGWTLCRKHHQEKESNSLFDFMEYWHISPIKLSPTLVALGQKLYPEQFKAFDIEKYRPQVKYEVQEFLEKNKGKVFRQGLSYA